MSDTTLKNARMSDGLERSLIREAIQSEASNASVIRSVWRRLKVRATGFAHAVGEMRHDMDKGRQEHPVVSAHRQ